jgi:hypothetical protein
MADKISVKTVIIISFICAIAVILYACMSPVNFQAFLGDENVQKYIETSNRAVKVDDLTGDNLKGRSARIEGLKSDRYYMVEKETDTEGEPVLEYNSKAYPMYVTDHQFAQIPGGLFPELQFITRINGGTINGLTDYHTYTVRAAVPFSDGNLTYTDGGGGGTKQILGGAVNIGGIYGTAYLNLSSVLAGSYEVIAVSAVNSQSPWNWTSKTSANWNSFMLEGPDTAVDYVFVKEDDLSSFKVLKVITGPSIAPVNITINISFDVVDETPVLNPSSYTLTQSDYYNNAASFTVTINFSNPGNVYVITGWLYDGKSTTLGTAASITLNSSSDADYFAAGKHVITLIVTKNGKPYSADFTLTVS